MDSNGTIHAYSEIELLRAEAAATLDAVVRARLETQLGGMVPIPSEYLDELSTWPRARRKAWRAEYRKALKRAKKTGKPVVVPHPKEV